MNNARNVDFRTNSSETVMYYLSTKISVYDQFADCLGYPPSPHFDFTVVITRKNGTDLRDTSLGIRGAKHHYLLSVVFLALVKIQSI
jgi:hypothetical protein